MNDTLKKKLWQAILFVVLYIPFPLLISTTSFAVTEKLTWDAIYLAVSLMIAALTKLMTARAKRKSLKVMWLILGLIVYTGTLFHSFIVSVWDWTMVQGY